MIFDTSPEGIGEYPGPIRKSRPETDNKREEDNKEVLEADATG